MTEARAPFFEQCPVCSATEASTIVEFPELRFARCATCGLVYKAEEQKDLRARLAKKYDADYFIHGQAQYLKRWAHRVAKCRRQLLMCLEFAPHSRRTLDVGCSAGYVLAAAASLGLEPTGMDIAAYAAKLARERGYGAATGSLTELPFRDGAFDVITAKHTLEHVDVPKRGLSELARVLAPGGVALVVVPDADYWHMRVSPKNGRYFRPDRLGWQHHVYYDVPTLHRALTQAGLEVVSNDKAMLRRRLAKGAAAPWEWLRFAALKTWTSVSKATRLRREIQLIARKPR
ncbi:MAG: class I SAM-dependent methyltransferase [Myxococcaceae bacterium]